MVYIVAGIREAQHGLFKPLELKCVQRVDEDLLPAKHLRREWHAADAARRDHKGERERQSVQEVRKRDATVSVCVL